MKMLVSPTTISNVYANLLHRQNCYLVTQNPIYMYECKMYFSSVNVVNIQLLTEYAIWTSGLVTAVKKI